MIPTRNSLSSRQYVFDVTLITCDLIEKPITKARKHRPNSKIVNDVYILSNYQREIEF